MTIGQKIKKYREAKNLTQKQVALRCRNERTCYKKLRIGKSDTICKANRKNCAILRCKSLCHFKSRSRILCRSYARSFYLEENYGVIPGEIDGEICLRFKDKFSTISSDVEKWLREYKAVQNASDDDI